MQAATLNQYCEGVAAESQLETPHQSLCCVAVDNDDTICCEPCNHGKRPNAYVQCECMIHHGAYAVMLWAETHYLRYLIHKREAALCASFASALYSQQDVALLEVQLGLVIAALACFAVGTIASGVVVFCNAARASVTTAAARRASVLCGCYVTLFLVILHTAASIAAANVSNSTFTFSFTSVAVYCVYVIMWGIVSGFLWLSVKSELEKETTDSNMANIYCGSKEATHTVECAV